MTVDGPGSWQAPASAPGSDGAPEPPVPGPEGAPEPPASMPPLLPPPPPAQPPVVMAWAAPSMRSMSVPGASGLEYGSVLARFVAYWLDGILVEIVGFVVVFVIALIVGGSGRLGLATLLAGVMFGGIHLLYFVGFWTGGARATLGMRLLKLSIGSATDGATLTVRQGIIRWLAIGGVFQVLSVVPGLSLITLIAPFWALALLVSTMASPTRQGLHDRAAGSAIVQPVGASSPALACLLIVGIIVAIGLISVVALIFLGSQMSNVLSGVGSSI